MVGVRLIEGEVMATCSALGRLPRCIALTASEMFHQRLHDVLSGLYFAFALHLKAFAPWQFEK